MCVHCMPLCVKGDSKVMKYVMKVDGIYEGDKCVVKERKKNIVEC